MSNGDGQILYLPLNQPRALSPADHSDKRHAVQTLGTPDFMSDAEIGAAMIFGDGNGLEIPSLSLGAGNVPHTIQAWLRIDTLPPFRAWPLCLGQSGPGAHHWLINADGRLQLGRWNGPQVVPVIEAGRWYHVAAAFDGKRLRAYLDGKPYGDGAETDFQFENTWLTLGESRWGNEAAFSGRIAHLRVHGRSLSDEEIAASHRADASLHLDFIDSHPLDLELLNDDEVPVLYITGDKPGEPLHIELTNVSSRSLLLRRRSGEPGPGANHFELRFRPDTLHVDTVAGHTGVEPADAWTVSAPVQHGDGTVSLYFLARETKMEVAPGQRLRLTLPSLKASPNNGARTARVELRYGELHFTQTPHAPIAGTRIAHLRILHRGEEGALPLHVGFVGSMAVVPGANVENELLVRLTNSSRDRTIAWNPGTEKGASAFVLGFDYKLDDELRDWALCHVDEATSIDVQCVPPLRSLGIVEEPSAASGTQVGLTLALPPAHPVGTGGKVFVRHGPTSGPTSFRQLLVGAIEGESRRRLLFDQFPAGLDLPKGTELFVPVEEWKAHAIDVEGQGPKWRITSDVVRALAPGESIDIRIAGIRTSQPVGPTNLYVSYQNVPAYGEDTRALAFMKSPLVEAFRAGTDQPVPALLVASDVFTGDAAHSLGMHLGNTPEMAFVQSQGNRPLRVNPHGQQVLIGAERGVDTPVSAPSNVGVHVDHPLAPLDIGGGFLLVRAVFGFDLAAAEQFFRSNQAKLRAGDLLIVPPNGDAASGPRFYWARPAEGPGKRRHVICEAELLPQRIGTRPVTLHE